jgi:hypothetical protein
MHKASPSENRGAGWGGLLVFVVLLACYLGNARALPGADSAPHRYLPLSVMCEGDLDFDELPLGWPGEKGLMKVPYWLVAGEDGHLYSTFGSLPGLQATPVFLVAKLLDPVFSWRRVLQLGKLAASLMVAAAGAFLFIGLRHRHGWRTAGLLALTYGLGTSMWSLGSQALWQHSAAAPWLCLALAFALSGRRLHWVGFFLGMAVLCRPSNLLLAAPLTVWVMLHRRASLLPFLALAAIPAAIQAIHGLAFFGDPLAFGQGLIGETWSQTMTGQDHVWTMRPLDVLAMWISPSRGLLVFSPILAVGLWGLVASLRRGGEPLLRWSLLGVVVVVTLHGLRFDWAGGWGFGYRNVLDVLPFMILGIGARIDRTPRAPMAILLACSVMIQVVGAIRYDLMSWNSTVDLHRHPERAWSLRDSQLVHYLGDIRWVPHDTLYMPARTFHLCPVELMDQPAPSARP